MKTITPIISTLLLMFIPHVVVASSRFDVSADYDNETKKPTPRILFEWFYDEEGHFGSGIEFKMTTSQKEKKVDGFDESKYASTYDEVLVRPNILNYWFKFGSLLPFVGVGLEYRKIANSEFGYFHLPEELGGTWVSFDNKIDIQAIFPALRAGVYIENDAINANASMDYYPSYWLDVKQNTSFHPIVDESGKTSGSSWQTNAGHLHADLQWKTGIIIEPLLKADFNFWSTAYDIKTLNYAQTSASFSFQDARVRTDYLSALVTANIALRVDIFQRMTPYLGIGLVWNKAKTTSSGKTSEESGSSLIFDIGIRTTY